MSKFKMGDRVLVPAEVVGFDSEGYVIVRFRGFEMDLLPEDLRLDTGRPLTAQEVREAWLDVPTYSEHHGVFQWIADRLNDVARGEGSE